MEAARKKADWIAATARRMGLENVSVAWARAEEWDGTAEVVVARALASLPVLCEYAAPLLAPGGRAVFWKGAVDAREEADGRTRRRSGAVGAESDGSARNERRSLWVFERERACPTGSRVVREWP